MKRKKGRQLACEISQERFDYLTSFARVFMDLRNGIIPPLRCAHKSQPYGIHRSEAKTVQEEQPY